MIINLPFTASYELPRTPVPRHFHLVLHVYDRGLSSAKLFERRSTILDESQLDEEIDVTKPSISLLILQAVETFDFRLWDPPYLFQCRVATTHDTHA